jgi:predicted RNA-binding Zn ribbon-like protein
MRTQVAVELVPAPADTLAIDFANTRYWRGSNEPTETLGSSQDLLDWAATTALVAPATLRRFRAAWTPPEFARAIEWREAIFRGLAAASGGSMPDAPDVALLNDALTKAPARQRLSSTGRGWEVTVMPPRAASLLAPVLWSAGDLLLGPKLARVRQCANPACQFLFLDDSKAGNRRWCSMSACGNRAKAHRHYLRQKASLAD